MATKKPITSTFQSSNHQILGGKAKIFRVPKSGDVYQFQMWLVEEKKYLRRTLKTRDLEAAIIRAEKIYLDTYSDISSGRKVFGATIGELFNAYIKYRENDVLIGNITKERLHTLKSQLRHFLNLKGRDTKISELNRNSCYDYQAYRFKEFPNTRKMSIKNEVATINAMMRYGFREEISHIERFDFSKLSIKGKDKSRRSTFTDEEYARLILAMRIYVSEKECEDIHERLERLMDRDAFYTASNTMLRVGELFNLKWKDILGFKEKYDEEEKLITMVKINVRPETDKTRRGREIWVRGGQYIERMRKRATYTSPEDFVFCAVGTQMKPNKMFWYNHWKVLMNLIDIGDFKERKITWYSCRHWGITCRIRAKVMLSDIAHLAGTSTMLVETNYGHWNDEMMMSASMKSFPDETYRITHKD